MPLKPPHRPLSIVLDTSDVHVETDTFGSGERGVQLRDKVRQAFGRVIDIANDRNADILLIVGDLFDSARVTEEGLAFAFGTIAPAQMPVELIPGNHDAHDGAIDLRRPRARRAPPKPAPHPRARGQVD